jgi:ABC-2 type transport system ATP-binding protein
MGFTYMAVEAVVYSIVFVLADSLIPTKWFPARMKWGSGSTGGANRSISVRKLVKKYDDETGVDEISLEIEQGEILTVIGPNAAGKSSLLGIIAGCREATRGQIDFFGFNGRVDLAQIHRFIGYCPQENICLSEMTAAEWLDSICALRGLPKYDYSEIFKSLGLDEQTRSRFGNMSGGNKRKVALATALVCRPPVVILDEATSGIDFTSRTRAWSLISGLKGTTVIMATHTLEECEKIADRIMVMADGKITNLATPTQLRREFGCGYLIETEEENAERLREILGQYEPGCELETMEGRVRVVVSADNVEGLIKVLHEIDFKYLMSIQSLEEKLFSHVQEREQEMARKKELVMEEKKSTRESVIVPV